MLFKKAEHNSDPNHTVKDSGEHDKVWLTPVADSLDSSEVQRGASDSSSWGDGPVWASRCTFSFRWLINTELSCGGCQRGFLMVKCIRDSSVLPFSACWYTDASVWPSDIHWERGEKINIIFWVFGVAPWRYSHITTRGHRIIVWNMHVFFDVHIPVDCHGAWCPSGRMSKCLPPLPHLRWSYGRSRWFLKTCSAGGRWGWRG